MERKESLISIIVPVYKVEKYLNSCINSILAQTYENIEIILVDDGSPDQCPQICNEYKKKDSRIKVIHQKNMGLSAARNTGIKNSNGEWICFIDSDDIIHKDYVKLLYETASNNDCQIALCNQQQFSKDSEINIFENLNSDHDVTILSKFEAVDKLFPGCGFIYHVAWNKIYKKEVFVNIEYPVGKIHEDTLTTYKLYLNCEKIALISDKLIFYRQRNDSIMANCNRETSLAAIRKMYIGTYKQIHAYKNIKALQMKILDHYTKNCITCWKKKYKIEKNDFKYITKEIKKNFLLLKLRKNLKILFWTVLFFLTSKRTFISEKEI